MTQRFGKWPKYLEMAQIHGARLQCLRNGFTMLEMAYEFDKRLKYVEMTYICGKGLKYLRND